MRKRQWDSVLYTLAEGQAGYFTANQARKVGIFPVRLVQLVASGDIDRTSRGVYRLTRFPVSPLGQYMEAALWPQVRRPDILGVISHESALAIHKLSDVNPAQIHITLPADLRVRRSVPKLFVLHYADLAAKDITKIEGVPVTTAVRAIREAHAAHLGPALIRQAIADGRRNGQLTLAEADCLEHKLLSMKKHRDHERLMQLSETGA